MIYQCRTAGWWSRRGMDVDVDTTDDDGPALVRVRIEGHSMKPMV